MKLHFRLLTSLLTIFLSVTASANDRYTNYQGQGVWSSDSSSPAVEVKLNGAYIYAQLRGQNVLPAVKLKSINSELLNEYTEKFIQLQDYNGDEFTDIGILKSVGYGGANRCYSIFEYQPAFYGYRSRSTKTVCVK